MFKKHLTRRQFLKCSASAATGAYCSLQFLPGTVWAAQKSSFITSSSFIKEFDVELRNQAAAFSKNTGHRFQIDTIHHKEKRVKLAAEAQAKAGHDLVMLRGGETYLYENELVDLGDLAKEIGDPYGGWHGIGESAAKVNGAWRAVPWYSLAFLSVYREDYFQEAGVQVPTKWSDIPNIGAKLKAKGHPIGYGISQTNDSVDTLYSVMWSYGSTTVDKDRNVVIESEATAEVIELVKESYSRGMTEEVLAWKDSSNNQFMLSGRGSWTFNPLSIYIVGKRKFPDIATKFNHHPGLEGPAGRHEYGVVYSLGIWKFAKNIELAKDFIRWHFQAENFKRGMAAAGGYNLSPVPAFDDHPVFDEDPRIAAVKGAGKYMHMDGWPAPPDAKAAEVSHLYIVPNMFAKAVTGTSTKDAMQWAAKEIEKVYTS